MIDQKTFKLLQGSFFLSCYKLYKSLQGFTSKLNNYTNGLKVRLEFAQLYEESPCWNNHNSCGHTTDFLPR